MDGECMDNNEILKLGDAAARKALTDVEFRKRLVADGNKAIKEEYGKEFPVKVTFHDFTDKKLTFVLPAKTEHGELGDDALSSVTGGLRDIDLPPVFNMRFKSRSVHKSGLMYAVYPRPLLISTLPGGAINIPQQRHKHPPHLSNRT